MWRVSFCVAKDWCREIHGADRLISNHLIYVTDLMSLSGMVEILCPFDLAQGWLEAKRGFVMPAQAGIHLRGRCKARRNLDSGLRRNDDPEDKMSSRQIQNPSA